MWLIWLFSHIAVLTGYRDRVAAILTWWLASTGPAAAQAAQPGTSRVRCLP